MTKPKATHGGKRLGAGRYRITGNAPGQGQTAQRITVTLASRRNQPTPTGAGNRPTTTQEGRNHASS